MLSFINVRVVKNLIDNGGMWLTNDVHGYIIRHNYHGHYLHAGGLSVNNCVRENRVREVKLNVRE